MKVFLVLLISYFLGAIPVALWVGRWWKGIDVRRHGSGNIGTTNAFRLLGTGPGTVVLILDMSKGALAASLGLYFDSPIIAVVAGLTAISGHNWSPFVKFKGGRGVATAAGVALRLMPKIGLTVFIIWALIVAITRYVSLGSIIAAILLPVLTLIWLDPAAKIPYFIFSLAAALFIIVRHFPNIKRLLNGTEFKFGGKAKS